MADWVVVVRVGVETEREAVGMEKVVGAAVATGEEAVMVMAGMVAGMEVVKAVDWVVGTEVGMEVVKEVDWGEGMEQEMGVVMVAEMGVVKEVGMVVGVVEGTEVGKVVEMVAERAEEEGAETVVVVMVVVGREVGTEVVMGVATGAVMGAVMAEEKGAGKGAVMGAVQVGGWAEETEGAMAVVKVAAVVVAVVVCYDQDAEKHTQSDDMPYCPQASIQHASLCPAGNDITTTHLHATLIALSLALTLWSCRSSLNLG